MKHAHSPATHAYYRIHIRELAYRTQQPKGLFVVVWNLVDQKVMTADEIDEYWRNRKWFEAQLPVPPFYNDGNTIKAITWYKNNEQGNYFFGKMTFYVSMARKYGRTLYVTSTDTLPGTVIYEDEYQIGVTDSRHDGPGFTTVEYGLSPPATSARA